MRTCSALTGNGIGDVWSLVEDYRSAMGESGELAARRAQQLRAWLWSEVSAHLMDALKADADSNKRLAGIEQLVIEGTLTPAAAARGLVEAFVEGGPAADSSASGKAKGRAGDR